MALEEKVNGFVRLKSVTLFVGPAMMAAGASEPRGVRGIEVAIEYGILDEIQRKTATILNMQSRIRRYRLRRSSTLVPFGNEGQS